MVFKSYCFICIFRHNIFENLFICYDKDKCACKYAGGTKICLYGEICTDNGVDDTTCHVPAKADDIGEDDIFGICATYPPRSFDRETCNPIPRHGFSSLCGSEQVPSDCAFSPGNEGSRGSAPRGVVVLGALVGLGALARSARRRRLTLTGRGA